MRGWSTHCRDRRNCRQLVAAATGHACNQPRCWETTVATASCHESAYGIRTRKENRPMRERVYEIAS